MAVLSKTFLVVFLTGFLISSISIAASGDVDKIELLCDGKMNIYENGALDIDVNEFVVVVDFESNEVRLSTELEGIYKIDKKTNERIMFRGVRGDYILVGGINRYTGSVIITNEWDENNKLLYHYDLHCKVSKRLF